MSDNNKMTKDELFNVFCNMFPNWTPYVKGYHKIGSRCLVITFFDDGYGPESRVFLYISPDNWQFGTKLWRKRSLNATFKKTKSEVAEDLAKELLQENNGGDQNEE